MKLNKNEEVVITSSSFDVLCKFIFLEIPRLKLNLFFKVINDQIS